MGCGVEEVQIGLGRGEDGAGVDRTCEGTSQGGGTTRGSAGDGVFKSRAVGRDLTLQLGLGHAVLNQATLLLLDGVQSAFPLARIELGRDGGDGDTVRQFALTTTGTDEGRVVGASQFAQSTVQNGRTQTAQQVLTAFCDAVGIAVRLTVQLIWIDD